MILAVSPPPTQLQLLAPRGTNPTVVRPSSTSKQLNAAWISLSLAAALVTASGFWVGRAMLRSIVILSEPGVSYTDEVGKVVTSKLYLPLCLVLLAVILVGTGLMSKTLRIWAAALALLLALPPIVMANSALNLREKLLSQPFDPQLRIAESYPASPDWKPRSSGGRADQYPEATVVWHTSSGVKETCNEITERINGWVDEIRESSVDKQDNSCKFVAAKGSDTIELKGFPLEERTIVSIKVTSTVPVRIEQFIATSTTGVVLTD